MKTKRQTLGDFALAVIFVVFIAGGALKAIGSLALEPDRALLAIVLDWALLALIAGALVVGIFGLRRISRNIDAEQAEAAEQRRAHADHAENVTLPRLRKLADDNPNMTPEYRAKLDELADAHPEFLPRADRL